MTGGPRLRSAVVRGRARRPAGPPSARRAVALILTAAVVGCAGGGRSAPAPAAPLSPNDAVFAALNESALAGSDVLALIVPAGDEGGPDEVILATTAVADPADVLAVLRDVEAYPETVDQVRRVEVLERGAEGVLFELELEVPLTNLVYELRYTFRGDDRIDVEGVSGVLEGGRFSWEVRAIDGGAMIVYTTRAALSGDAGVLVNAILQIHPDLQEGLMFSQGLRFLRAIRGAAELRARGAASSAEAALAPGAELAPGARASTRRAAPRSRAADPRGIA